MLAGLGGGTAALLTGAALYGVGPILSVLLILKSFILIKLICVAFKANVLFKYFAFFKLYIFNFNRKRKS